MPGHDHVRPGATRELEAGSGTIHHPILATGHETRHRALALASEANLLTRPGPGHRFRRRRWRRIGGCNGLTFRSLGWFSTTSEQQYAGGTRKNRVKYETHGKLSSVNHATKTMTAVPACKVERGRENNAWAAELLRGHGLAGEPAGRPGRLKIEPAGHAVNI